MVEHYVDVVRVLGSNPNISTLFIMTPWILQNKFLWQQPCLIIIEENNYFYEEYENFVVIGYNFFSFIEYIHNHLSSMAHIILNKYQSYSGPNKIIYLKKLMASYDNKIYYFFITKNFYNHELIQEKDYILTLKNNFIEGKNIIYCDDYHQNNSYEILPYFHKIHGITISNSYELPNNNRFYFWNHIINYIKLKKLSIVNDTEIFLKSCGYFDGTIDSNDYPIMMDQLRNQLFIDNAFYNKIHYFYPWILGDEELNALVTLRDDHYQYSSLLWKNMETPIIIEGNSPEIYKNTKEYSALGWSLSNKIYYYHKKKIVYKNQTNLHQLLSKNIKHYSLPWDLFNSTSLQYNLENIINIENNSLWFRSILKNNDTSLTYPETITIKEYGWIGYYLPLDPWIIQSHYHHLFIKIIINIGGCYYVKNKNYTGILIKNNDESIINILIFIIKKSMKNDELDPIIYIFNDDYEIIDTYSWNMAGYFVINTIEDKIHRFFLSHQ